VRLVAACVFVLLPYGQPAAHSTPYQCVTTSWPGLSGLFVIPTARLIGYRHLSVGFNESKHSEYLDGKFTDRQIRGVFTYGAADWLEIYGSYYNNVFITSRAPNLSNEMLGTFGLKARILLEHPRAWYPEVSVAVRDIADSTRDVGPLQGVNNGRKFFLLASKKLFRNDAVGRFLDLHAGMTWDSATTAGLAGFELTLAPNASLIAEGMWDAPYLDFRSFGQNDVRGRFIFDAGLRIYPELVPGLALDMGFVGDSEFEFSFGASYQFGM
jgi:hypothetical protein